MPPKCAHNWCASCAVVRRCAGALVGWSVVAIWAMGHGHGAVPCAIATRTRLGALIGVFITMSHGTREIAALQCKSCSSSSRISFTSPMCTSPPTPPQHRTPHHTTLTPHHLHTIRTCTVQVHHRL